MLVFYYTAARVKGYSLDPLDNAVSIWYQEPESLYGTNQTYVRRLIQTQQATGCERAKSGIQGDVLG
jgi:hypothetical protein